MVICIPSGITGVERRAVQEAAEYAGARKPVMVIERRWLAPIRLSMNQTAPPSD
jgi:rod shape-determining protein MreB